MNLPEQAQNPESESVGLTQYGTGFFGKNTTTSTPRQPNAEYPRACITKIITKITILSLTILAE